MALALRRVEALRHREALLRSFGLFFRRLSELAAWRQTELPALIGQLAAETEAFSFPGAVLAAYRDSGDLEKAWALTVTAASSQLRTEETNVLRLFAPVFRSAAASVFCEKCALAAESFEGFAAEAQALRLRQTRLSLSFGAFGAALLLILVL